MTDKPVSDYLVKSIRKLRDTALNDIEQTEGSMRGADQETLKAFIQADLWLKFHDAAVKKAADENTGEMTLERRPEAGVGRKRTV